MNDCKHETIIFRYNEAPHCYRCGLLKSTIESGDTAPIINKAGLEKSELVVSPDSWEKQFDEKFKPQVGIPITDELGVKRQTTTRTLASHSDVKDFIRNLVSEVIESIPDLTDTDYRNFKQNLRSKYGIK